MWDPDVWWKELKEALRVKTVNAKQLAALRIAAKNPTGRVEMCDRTTLKALRDRGLAMEIDGDGRTVFRIKGKDVVFATVDEDRVFLEKPRPDRWFFLTDAGRARAKLKADVWGESTYEGPRDESLMQDL